MMFVTRDNCHGLGIIGGIKKRMLSVNLLTSGARIHIENSTEEKVILYIT